MALNKSKIDEEFDDPAPSRRAVSFTKEVTHYIGTDGGIILEFPGKEVPPEVYKTLEKVSESVGIPPDILLDAMWDRLDFQMFKKYRR